MIKKIVVEVPVSWTKNPVDGHKHKRFIANLIIALTERKIPLYFREVYFGADNAPRLPEKHTLVFSYHSWGSEKNVLKMKEAPVTPLFSIDQTGYSGWADIVTNYQKYSDEIDKITDAEACSILDFWKNHFLITNESKYPQPEVVVDEKFQNYVFYPMQVQNDPVAVHSEINGLDLLIEAASFAEKNQIFLLVKRHPFCQSYAVEENLALLQKQNPWVIKVESNVHQLIRQAKSVITINSGVGIEALIDGASVFCAGKCEWHAACNPINDFSDLELAFTIQPPKMNNRQKKILAFLLTKYWVNPEKPENFDYFIDKAFDAYDPQFGISEISTSASEVLLPVILDLQGKLEYEKRKATQSTLDIYASIDINETLKKDIKQLELQLHEYIERLRQSEDELEQLKNRFRNELMN